MADHEATEPNRVAKENQQYALAGDLKEFKAQMKTAALLEEALSIIRSSARTNDYFVGYSLSEVVAERIKTIGEDADDDDKPYSEIKEPFIKGSHTVIKEKTRMARLNYLWEILLGSDEGNTLENGGAIGRAINFKSIKDLAWPEDGAGEGTGF